MSKATISFHKLDHSDSLENKVNEKNDLLTKKHSDLTKAEWFLSQENCKESKGKTLFKSTVHLHLKQKREISATSIEDCPFKSVSNCYRKIENQLKRF